MVTGPGHGQPDARQQPVEPFHDLLVAVHDQNFLASGRCGNVTHWKKLTPIRNRARVTGPFSAHRSAHWSGEEGLI
jgi:hypothetical protein